MKRIGVFANREKDIGLKYTKILIDSILNNGGQVNILPDIAKELDVKCDCPTEMELISNSDAVICLGGDGTFLKGARQVFDKNIPILGINMGSLGFLTEVERTDIDVAIKKVIEDDYEIEERMMLDTTIIRDGKVIAKDTALNDIVISRGALSRILHIKAYINDVFVDTFPGDGLIVSSPTGSTAYTLSVGGPIVEPDIDLIIVSPICPHILYARSVVTTADRVVRAVVAEEYCHNAMVTIDGQEGYEIMGGDIIEVKKSSYTIKLIRVKSRNFFNVLRTKIHDRGESLRKDEI